MTFPVFKKCEKTVYRQNKRAGSSQQKLMIACSVEASNEVS